MLELKVNVQIGVTPEVVSLVSAILNKPAAVEAPAAAAPVPAAQAPATPAGFTAVETDDLPF